MTVHDSELFDAARRVKADVALLWDNHDRLRQLGITGTGPETWNCARMIIAMSASELTKNLMSALLEDERYGDAQQLLDELRAEHDPF